MTINKIGTLAGLILGSLLSSTAFAFPHISHPWDVTLYEAEGLRVTSNWDVGGTEATKNAWCEPERHPVRVVAEYTAPNEERDALFPSDYASFVENIIVPKIREHCPGFPHTEGETVYQGVALIFVRKTENYTAETDSIYFEPRRYEELKSYGLASVNRAAREKEREKFMNSCPDGPFCELPGGDYLNSIYEGKTELVTVLDNKLVYEDPDPVKQYLRKLGGSSRPFLLAIAEHYMYQYQTQPGSCFAADSAELTVRTQDVELVEKEVWSGLETGRRTTIGGSKRSIRVNPEFRRLCGRLCSVNSHAAPAIWSNTVTRGGGDPILEGVERMMKDYDCNDPKVKQFERNLISLSSERLSQQ